MSLQSDSVKWAIEFLSRHSDGDIFPSIPEISAVNSQPDELIKELVNKQLSQLIPQGSRRFIVPTGELSYRQATQLHPQDSILLTALVYQYGNGIECSRLSQDYVYSYRFDPQLQFGLYGPKSTWNEFWAHGQEKAKDYPYILYCDIADFYNQIYHHTVENQLLVSKFPGDAVNWILKLLKSTTANVSRGIPIGPHATHLIAECTMVPIDDSLRSHGIEFIRYADDLLVFASTRESAASALYQVATTLDRQQRLTLQKHKTKIFAREEFQVYCNAMIEDRPISTKEDQILRIIRKYSGGNPYARVTYNQVSGEDWKAFSGDIIKGIIEEYLQKDETDYVRLRWFYRRLAQVGHPDALEVTIDNIDSLAPCLSSVCTYVSSIQSIPDEQWKEVGGKLLDLISKRYIFNGEFARLSLFSLFSKNEHINHFNRLAPLFSNSDPSARREILLAAKINSQSAWLREHKEGFEAMDAWQKMAFIYCASVLPTDEKGFFLRKRIYSCDFDKQLSVWARKQ